MSTSVTASAARPITLERPPPAERSLDLHRGLIVAFLVAGVMIRLTRYLLCFPLWEDEAFLAYNLMSRGFSELLQPLDYIQVAPLGYLWLQRATIEVLGFTEHSLRLWSLLAGLASLFLFHRLAKLTLSRSAQVFAVAVFAVSYPMVRYSAEAKQYGFDLFLGLAMLCCLLEWRRRPERQGWPWLLVGLASVGPFFSHPIVFIGGAVSVVWLHLLWRARGGRTSASEPIVAPDPVRSKQIGPGWRPSAWGPWLLFNVLLAASFLVHLSFARAAVGSHNDAGMQEHWADAFPPLGQPLELAGWLVTTHAGDFLAYPLGGPRGGSTLTFLGVIAGFALWFRNRRGLLLTLALVPVGLNFAAAALRQFPYGGHFKFGVYWAPLGVLLLGTALGALAPAGSGVGRFRRRAAEACLVLLAAIGVSILIRDFVSPSKCPSDQRARDFARWFWHDAPHDAVVVCLHGDLHLSFNKDLTSRLNWSAAYACNRRIYSPRHARGETPAWDEVSAATPLRCVEYRVAGLEYDEAARDRWLAEMAKTYDLTGRDRFPAVRYDKRDLRFVCADFIESYTFIPKRSN